MSTTVCVCSKLTSHSHKIENARQNSLIGNKNPHDSSVSSDIMKISTFREPGCCQKLVCENGETAKMGRGEIGLKIIKIIPHNLTVRSF